MNSFHSVFLFPSLSLSLSITLTNTHTHISHSDSSKMASANLPGSTSLIAQLILIYSHLSVETYTLLNVHCIHTHTLALTLRFSFSLSPPLAVRQCACFIAVWNCFGMSLAVGREQPQMFGHASSMMVCVFCGCVHICRLNVCLIMCDFMYFCLASPLVPKIKNVCHVLLDLFFFACIMSAKGKIWHI